MGVTNFDFDPILKLIPQLQSLNPDEIRINRLSGYTNTNFYLRSKNHAWVLRIPRPETSHYVNRRLESHNQRIAEELGLAAKCLWRDDAGLSLTMALVNSRPVTGNDLDEDELFGQLVARVKRLHTSKKKFLGSVDLVQILVRYYGLLPDRYQRTGKAIFEFALVKAKTFKARDTRLVPSHNDLVPENILINNSDRIWFIDWEYASMASPFWDLATICNSFQFDLNVSSYFLKAYQDEVTESDLELLVDYRYVLQVLSVFWMAVFTDSDIESEIARLENDLT